VSAIREQVGALDAHHRGVLAFARFPQPQYEEDSVNEIGGSAGGVVRPVATRQASAVEATNGSGRAAHGIDRDVLLRQAVLNLVKNGLEALGRGGKLTVGTRRVDDQVEITVRDTGSGIAPRWASASSSSSSPQASGHGAGTLYLAADSSRGSTAARSHGRARLDRGPLSRYAAIKRAQDV